MDQCTNSCLSTLNSRVSKRPPEHNPETYVPGSLCFCRQCGTSSPHRKGKPCESITCPRCGAPMTRKF